MSKRRAFVSWVIIGLLGAALASASDWETVAGEGPALDAVAQRLQGHSYTCTAKFKKDWGNNEIRIVPFRKGGKVTARVDTRGDDVGSMTLEQISDGRSVFIQLELDHNWATFVINPPGERFVLKPGECLEDAGFASEGFDVLVPHETVKLDCCWSR